MEPGNKDAFAIWVTGLPASGKSTLVACLKDQLADRGIDAAVLESDVLREFSLPSHAMTTRSGKHSIARSST